MSERVEEIRAYLDTLANRWGGISASHEFERLFTDATALLTAYDALREERERLAEMLEASAERFKSTTGALVAVNDQTKEKLQQAERERDDLVQSAQNHERILLEGEARERTLREALKECVTALDSEDMKAIWPYLHVHRWTYKGPTVDIAKCKQALADGQGRG